MPNFRKKPVVVHGEIIEDQSSQIFTGVQFDLAQPFPSIVTAWNGEEDPGDGSVGFITSRRGRMHLRDSDWLFTAPKGDHFIVLNKSLTTYYEQIA